MRFRDTESLRRWCVEAESMRGGSPVAEKKVVSLTQKVNLMRL